MDKQNENYIESQERWQKEQELLIEMIQHNLDNSNKMISVHKRNAKLMQENLEFEKQSLQHGRDMFEQWKENNA